MEVMVSVMIVSVVIASLLQMRGNSNQKFFRIKEMVNSTQYNSFLLYHGDKYGYEKSNIDMKTLVDNFDLESDLRRKLSSMKVKLDYEELSTIDTSEFDDSEQNTSTGVVFEIGRTLLNTEEFTTSYTNYKRF